MHYPRRAIKFTSVLEWRITIHSFIIREQQSEGFAAKLKSIIRHRFPGTKINTDDGLGWITQPFDYRQYNDTI
jgi:hypothetical protein